MKSQSSTGSATRQIAKRIFMLFHGGCCCNVRYVQICRESFEHFTQKDNDTGYSMKKGLGTGLKITVLLVISLVLLAGCAVYESVVATDEKADLETFYGVSSAQAAVFVNNEQLEETAVAEDGTYYISEAQIRKTLDKRFYWDGKDDQLLFTDAKKIHKESISDGSMVRIQDQELYLSTACLEKYLDVEIRIFDDPARIYIDTAGSSVESAKVKKDTQVRTKGGYRSPILTEVSSDDTVQILTRYDNWARVRTDDGFVGYVLLRSLDQDHIQTAEVPSSKETAKYQSLRYDKPVCLVWQDMENTSGNRQFASLIDGTEGINVVSPAWFALSANDGTYRNLASTDYVATAHKKGMKVWVLVDDFDHSMSIGKVLGTNEIRQKLAENLIRDVKAVGADGINVDFEYITDSCGKDFIQFLRELYLICRRENLVLSVDNTNPTFVKYCYDMEEQGKVADYVVLMGYDEHWQGSEAGSVSSLSYVKDGIEAALDMVPAEKIISGLPFYARVWTEIPEDYAKSTDQIRQDGNSEYESYSLTSEALSMDQIAALIRKAGVTPEWDESVGQYYVEIPLKHGKQRIWVEDEKSLKTKLDTVSSYSLGGIAFWKLGMEDKAVWKMISGYVKSGQ